MTKSGVCVTGMLVILLVMTRMFGWCSEKKLFINREDVTEQAEELAKLMHHLPRGPAVNDVVRSVISQKVEPCAPLQENMLAI